MIVAIKHWLVITAVATVATSILALLICPWPEPATERWPWQPNRPDKRTAFDYRHALLTFLALSMLGASAGMIGGLSRIGVAGQVVPAAFTLVGVVGLYLFAVKTGESGPVALAVVALTSSMFIGYIDGSLLRSGPDRIAYWRNTCVSIYSGESSLPDPAMGKAIFGPICGSVLGYEKNSLKVRP